MKISNIYEDIELVQEGFDMIDEYDNVEGMLIAEGYAKTYSFHYPKRPDNDVTDENPTVIILCTYRHPNGNTHLAGLNINPMKSMLDAAEKLIAKAEALRDKNPEKEAELMEKSNYWMKRYEQIQRGLQDILSYEVKVEEVDEAGNKTIVTRRKPRPCRSKAESDGRYARGANSRIPEISTLFTNQYRTYNMANIVGGREAMLSGTVSFTPRSDAIAKRKARQQERRDEKKREMEREKEEAEIAKKIKAEPTPPIGPEEPDLEEPEIDTEEEEEGEEELPEEFIKDLNGILVE
jgi:hypothetical protein